MNEDKRRLSKQAEYERKKAAATADIGPIRPVKNPKRKKACRLNLLKFLTTYFPGSTGLHPFSADHKRVISRIQTCILQGGRYAQAIYRGFAKTTITENAALWATLYGHRRFVALFGANAPAAAGNIESIKLELETNDLLDQDFPEVTQAIRALDRKVQRCKSQTCDGLPTFVEWTADKIVFPTIHKSVCSGAVITAQGLTAGGIRGMKHKRADGTQQRPDQALLDDPQTDESAKSPAGNAKRLDIIKKVILRLAGHRTSIACIVNGTIIAEDDVVEQLTDPARNPAWQSERIRMVEKWADVHDTLWMDQYATRRRSYNPDELGDQERAHRDATKFYKQHRAEMERGCRISWDYCFDPDHEISAIQHAYNILIDDGQEVFDSECQSTPPKRAQAGAELLSAHQIASKVTRIPRGRVPSSATRLTAFVDVQQPVLYWLVAAWDESFSGSIVDYGTFPEQKRPYFTLREAKHTFAREFPDVTGVEALVYAGLKALTNQLLGRNWPRDGGGQVRIERCFVDMGWITEIVKNFCRQSLFAALIRPTKGFGIPASRPPMAEWRAKQGDRAGLNWIDKAPDGGKPVRSVVYDTNFWKTFVHNRFSAPMGGKGSLTLCGTDPEEHRMLADHLTAEFREPAFARGRWVDEWAPKPHSPDNHWLDCLVGATVAASTLGCRLPDVGDVAPRAARTGPRSRVRLSAPPGHRSFFVTDR